MFSGRTLKCDGSRRDGR